MIRPGTLAVWQQPTPTEVRELLKSQGWTGSEAGQIAGVTSRTVRRWTGGDLAIPYACWRSLVDAAEGLPSPAE